jgi:hypothetical protein
MANGVYNRGKFLLGTGLNLNTASLHLVLVANTYSFDNDHNTLVDLEGSEITTGTVSGYSRQTLTSTDVIEDDSLDFAYLYAANVTFSSLGTGNTVGGAVLVANTGGGTTNANCAVLAFYDIVDTPTNGGDITIQWASNTNGAVLKLA